MLSLDARAPLKSNTLATAPRRGIRVQRVARAWLIAVGVLNGLAGLVCGVLLIARPDGALLMATALLPVVNALPFANVFFRDLFWIGAAMILALGLPNTVAAVALIRRNARQYQDALASAVLLMLWSGFELIYMFNLAAVGYFIVGAVSTLCALWLLGRPQEASASQALRADAAR